MTAIAPSARGDASARTAALWSATVALVCVGQWLLLQSTPLLVGVFVWGAGLGLFVWLQWPTVGEAAAPTVEDGRSLLAWWRWSLVGVAVVTGLTIWVRARGRPEQADWTDITLLWAIGVVAMLVAVLPVRDRRQGRAGRRRRLAGVECSLVVAVMVVAVAARLIALGRFPIVEGDGMSLSLLGRQFIDGDLTDPFSTAFFDNPTLYPFLQSAVMRVFGESLFSARLLSAAVGSLTVLATYAWCRRLLGVKVALIASALLATLPIHLYFSRISLNLVEDAFFLVIILWLLDRALVDGRRIDAVLAGLALGFSQYFYFGARLLLLIVAALLAYFVSWWHRRGRSWRDALGRVARAGAWISAGAVVVCMPLVAHFVDQPEDLHSRYRQVAFFGPALDNAREATGASTVELVTDQATRAALLPFSTPTQSVHWHPEAPIIGLPVAVLAALGLAVATVAIRQRRYFPVAVAWWLSLAGVGLTIGLNAQRWILAYPLVAVMAAIGLEAVWRVMRYRLVVPARWATAIVSVIVVGVMLWSVTWFFRDSNTLTVWSDPNSLVAHELVGVLDDEPDGTTVYTAFSPRMSFSSHSTVPFLADHVNGVELEEVLRAPTDVPSVGGRTVFAFLPERLGELDVVRSTIPGGVTDEVRYRDALLFVTYAVHG